jgi:uncharacterized membrane protein
LTAVIVTYTVPLPVLVQGNDYSGGFAGTWQIVLGTALTALVVTVVYTRLSTVLDLWLTVVLCATLFDAALTIVAHQRFSVGWYLARVFSVITALIVALVFVADLSRLYQRFARLAFGRRADRRREPTHVR